MLFKRGKEIYKNSLIQTVVLRQVHSPFHSDVSTGGHLVFCQFAVLSSFLKIIQ